MRRFLSVRVLNFGRQEGKRCRHKWKAGQHGACEVKMGAAGASIGQRSVWRRKLWTELESSLSDLGSSVKLEMIWNRLRRWMATMSQVNVRDGSWLTSTRPNHKHWSSHDSNKAECRGDKKAQTCADLRIKWTLFLQLNWYNFWNRSPTLVFTAEIYTIFK